MSAVSWRDCLSTAGENTLPEAVQSVTSEHGGGSNATVVCRLRATVDQVWETGDRTSGL